MKDIKIATSLWINQRKFTLGKFSWQEGYGVFSYSHSQIDQVIMNINNQETHHRKKSFTEEYKLLLEKFDIPYDEKYIFKEIN